MIDEKVIRERIQKACVAKGYTRYKLAVDSGISYAALCRFLNGQTNVTLYMVQKLSEALDMPYEKFILDEALVDKAVISTKEWQLIAAVRNLDTSMQTAVYNFISAFTVKKQASAKDA